MFKRLLLVVFNDSLVTVVTDHLPATLEKQLKVLKLHVSI